MNRTVLSLVFTLLAGFFVVACDSENESSVSDVPATGAASQGSSEDHPTVADLLGPDGLELLSDDPASSKKEFLITGESASSPSFWMCTFTESDQYIDRSAIRFNLDGSGSIEGSPISWMVQTGSFTITTANEILSFVNIEFSQRLYRADKFTADITNGKMISCDWTGEPRTGELLNDPTDSFEATDERLFLDSLISTGNDVEDQDTYWICSFAEYTVPLIHYYFFGNTSFLSSIEQGRWGLSGDDEFFLKPDQSEVDTWSNVKFGEVTDEGYNNFTALSSMKGMTSCTIGGKPLSEIYVPK